MKNFKLIAFSAAGLIAGTMAVGQARDGSVTIDRETRQAAVITIDQPVNITSDALNHRLQGGSGMKSKTRRGITTYNRVILSDISPDRLDFYTKVEKGAGNTSIVSMAASRGYSGISTSVADSNITVNLKKYLDSFVNDANNHSADLDIGYRIKELNEGEKKYQQLLEEQGTLNKKRADIDNRLYEIQRELRVKQEEITIKKSNLETARNRRNILSSH